MPDSTVTFAAIPAGGAAPVNAILTPGEERTFRVEAGDYEVAVRVATNSYPPTVLLDTRLRGRLAAGAKYQRKFTKENVQPMAAGERR